METFNKLGKGLALLLAVLLTNVGIAQISPANNTWLPSGGTLASGTYTGIGWSGALVIPAGNEVTLNNPNFSSGSLTVYGTLHVTGSSFQLNGSTSVYGILSVQNTLQNNSGYLDVKSTGKVNAKDLSLNNPHNTISGVVTVDRTTTIHNGPTTFTECGKLYTKDFNNWSGPNPIQGSGFISISGTYQGSNSLTSQSTIGVNYLGTGSPNFGAATLTSVPHCTALPIKYVPGSFRQEL